MGGIKMHFIYYKIVENGYEDKYGFIFNYKEEDKWHGDCFFFASNGKIFFEGPKIQDIIFGFDPDEDDPFWGFHSLPQKAIEVTKEEIEKIKGFKINENELNEYISKNYNELHKEYWKSHK